MQPRRQWRNAFGAIVTRLDRGGDLRHAGPGGAQRWSRGRVRRGNHAGGAGRHPDCRIDAPNLPRLCRRLHLWPDLLSREPPRLRTGAGDVYGTARRLPGREGFTYIRRDNTASIAAHTGMGMWEAARPIPLMAASPISWSSIRGDG